MRKDDLGFLSNQTACCREEKHTCKTIFICDQLMILPGYKLKWSPLTEVCIRHILPVHGRVQSDPGEGTTCM